MINNCSYCKYWKDVAYLTSIPGVETDLMGDRIIIRPCGKSRILIIPGNYSCDEFESKDVISET